MRNGENSHECQEVGKADVYSISKDDQQEHDGKELEGTIMPFERAPDRHKSQHVHRHVQQPAVKKGGCENPANPNRGKDVSHNFDEHTWSFGTFT